MLAEFPGPQRGDKVLLINPDQTPGMVELFHLVFENARVRLTIVPTVAGAMGEASPGEVRAQRRGLNPCDEWPRFEW